MSNQLKLFRESETPGEWLLEQSKRNEWGAQQAKIRKQEYEDKKQFYAESNSLLKRKKIAAKTKVPQETTRTLEPKEGPAWDRFRKVRFSLKKPDGKQVPFMTDVNIWELIQKQTKHSLDYVYDIAYNNYLRGDITPDQWHAFENLIWNKGVPLFM